ncbi:hypothetical protein V7O67_02315 [Methanolobus sp. ZRKC4]
MIGISSLVTVDSSAINDIGNIITSVLTLLIGYALTRRAYIRWRKQLYCYLCVLWISVIIINLTLVPDLLISLLFITLVIVALLLRIFYHIICLELIGFSKDTVESNKNITNIKLSPPEFNMECLDKVIESAKNQATDAKKQFHPYPIILAADESWRPWQVAENLVSPYLNEESGVIYFTFARPHEKIKKALEDKIKKSNENANKKWVENKLKNVVIIDCYKKLTSEKKEKKYHINLNRPFDPIVKEPVLIADPRNPHLLNKKYEEALQRILKNKKCSKICVVYDSLSDFLCFTDREIAIQYLRHNMYWEEKHNISSLYILRLGTLDKLYEEYLLWFANVVIYLENKNGKPVMRTSGLLSGPTCTDINYNFESINKNHFDYTYS